MVVKHEELTSCVTSNGRIFSTNKHINTKETDLEFKRKWSMKVVSASYRITSTSKSSKLIKHGCKKKNMRKMITSNKNKLKRKGQFLKLNLNRELLKNVAKK